MKRIIEKTDDGSTTLFVPELNEHYHSTKGARTESQHIFINMGLKASTATTPHILEIGFGTGLNAWLTLEEAEKSGRNVYYTGLELYPLEWQLVEQLGYISANEQLMTGDNQCPAHELFNRLYVLLNNGGILTTYCAKGVVRRMLQAAGFIVERLPGPPGGKREILRARKQE